MTTLSILSYLHLFSSSLSVLILAPASGLAMSIQLFGYICFLAQHLASGGLSALRGGRSRGLGALDGVPRRAPRLLRGVLNGALAALVRVRGALLDLRVAG